MARIIAWLTYRHPSLPSKPHCTTFGLSTLWTMQHSALASHIGFAKEERFSFALVHFSFADDTLSPAAVSAIEAAATVLRRFGAVVGEVLVSGYARPGAPPMYGASLSQARAF